MTTRKYVAPARRSSSSSPFNFNLNLPAMLQQAIPGAVIGIIVIFANFKVTESQVSDLRRENEARIVREQSIQGQLTTLNGEIIKLGAQLNAYLAQQSVVNSAINDRVTYIERQDNKARR